MCYIALSAGYYFLYEEIWIPRFSYLHLICTFNFEKIFWKIQTLFRKLENRFLVESPKNDNATFTYKIALLEGNVDINRIRSTKWVYHKNGVLPVTTLFFWKFCFSLRTSYKELICCTNNPNEHEVSFDGAFSLWLSLSLSLKFTNSRRYSAKNR